jgi:hypothetical protein
MGAERWVAEDPRAHLLPHLERACVSLPFELTDAETSDDGVFVVSLAWQGERSREGEVRAAAFALIGSVAETATYVRQRRVTDGLVFEVATGFIAGDAHFAPHGHTLSLHVADCF